MTRSSGSGAFTGETYACKTEVLRWRLKEQLGALFPVRKLSPSLVADGGVGSGSLLVVNKQHFMMIDFFNQG